METLGKRALARFERPLYVLIVAVLVFVLLHRLERYAELAEKAAMQSTLISLQTALQLRFILAVGHTAPAALAAAWTGGNPVALSGVALPGYLGARHGVDLKTVPGNSWLFDAARGELVYVPLLARHLRVREGTDGVPALRFRLRVVRRRNGGGWQVRLVAAFPYTWKASGL